MAKQTIRRHGCSKPHHSLGWWLLLASVCGFACLRWVTQRHAPHLIPQPSVNTSDVGPPLVFRASLPPADRPVYPYSVIPGGIESPKELKEAMASDPVVAAHFRGFNLAALRVVRLQSERLVYVSYRLHDDVFWTRKQLRLLAGEKLITDGTYSARTRCGNRTSIVPQAKTLPSEPSVQELETPQSPELYSALSPALPSTLNKVVPLETDPPSAPSASEFAGPGGVAGGVPVGGLLYPPLLPGGAAGVPIGGVVSPTLLPGSSHFPSPCDPTKDQTCPIPPAIPEPGTWLLVAPGLAYLFYRWRLRASGR